MIDEAKLLQTLNHDHPLFISYGYEELTCGCGWKPPSQDGDEPYDAWLSHALEAAR